METRQELEERLETLLSDILNEVQSRQGQSFDGELEDAIILLKEVKLVLKQLNEDKYDEDEMDEEDGGIAFHKRKIQREEDEDEDSVLIWKDDYDEGY